MPDILENGLQRWTPVILVTKNDKQPPEEWSIDRVYKFFRDQAQQTVWDGHHFGVGACVELNFKQKIKAKVGNDEYIFELFWR